MLLRLYKKVTPTVSVEASDNGSVPQVKKTVGIYTFFLKIKFHFVLLLLEINFWGEMNVILYN